MWLFERESSYVVLTTLKLRLLCVKLMMVRVVVTLVLMPL